MIKFDLGKQQTEGQKTTKFYGSVRPNYLPHLMYYAVWKLTTTDASYEVSTVLHNTQ